jgi:hypothetical protein
MKERSIKELLQLMLDNQNLFKEGLCSWNNELYWSCLITRREHDILRNYIRYNRPSIFSSIKAFVSRNSGYYWECGDIKPRIKWLKKHINKIK